jgi:hypothetical protein
MTGMSKGEATVTYDDANAARSAINWFDGNFCCVQKNPHGVICDMHSAMNHMAWQ